MSLRSSGLRLLIRALGSATYADYSNLNGLLRFKPFFREMVSTFSNSETRGFEQTLQNSTPNKVRR